MIQASGYKHVRALVALLMRPASAEVPPEVNDFGSADWREIFDLALRNKVFLQLAKRISWDNFAIPADVAREAAETRRQVMCRHMLTLGLHHRLVSKYLEPMGLNYALVKGFALASGLYSEPTDREFCDIDILLEPKDAVKLAQRLLSEGYLLVNDFWGVGIEHLANFGSVIELQTPGGCGVEIHRTLDQYGILFPPEECLRRKKRRNLAGIDCWVLCDEDMIDYVIFHNARHKWASLHWCIDLMLIQRSGLFGAVPGKSSSAGLLEPTIASSQALASELEGIHRGRSPEVAENRSFLQACIAGIAHAGVETDASAEKGDPDFPFPWQITRSFRIRRRIARLRPRLDELGRKVLPMPLWWIYWIERAWERLVHTLKATS